MIVYLILSHLSNSLSWHLKSTILTYAALFFNISCYGLQSFFYAKPHMDLTSMFKAIWNCKLIYLVIFQGTWAIIKTDAYKRSPDFGFSTQPLAFLH